MSDDSMHDSSESLEKPRRDEEELSNAFLDADDVDDALPLVSPHVDPEVLADDAKEAERRKHRRRMSPEHVRRIKRKKRIRVICIVIGALLLVIASLVAWLSISAIRAKNEVSAAIVSAGQVQSQIESGKTQKAKICIEQFSQHIDKTYAQTKQPIWGLAEFIPYYGSDVKAARKAVRVLEDVSNNALPKLADSVESLDFSHIGFANGTIQLGNLESIAPDLTAANEFVADANIQLNNIGDTHIPQLTEALAKGKTKLAQLANLTDMVSRIADVLPSMLNVNSTGGKARTYLVLAQNNAELRATGGIPASWGTLTVDKGKMSIGAFEAPPADGQFTEEESISALTADERNLFSPKMATDYRDINFTPDFPRTAELASQMWSRSDSGTVDGVLSVDPVFLQQLLKVTGSVTLTDGTVLTGDNAAQILLNQTYIDKPTEREQNVFFTMAATQVFNLALTNLDGKNEQLIAMFRKAIEESHVYVWSSHEDEQQRIEGTVISGALQSMPAQPVTGVYFNDGTMSKMDWYLKREVTSTYDKTYPSGAKQYTIHVKLTNTADKTQVNAAPDYLRGFNVNGSPRHGEIETILYIYAPDEGRLVDWTQDFDQIATHDQLTVGVKTVTLQPGESFETTIHVLTSPMVGENAMILRQTPLIQ